MTKNKTMKLKTPAY